MSLIKRLSVSLRAGLDRAVGEIEDHDAVVEAALDELRDAIARVRVEKAQVERRLVHIDQRIDQAAEQSDRWRERARREADEDRALECLRRHKSERQRTDQLKDQRQHISVSLQRVNTTLAELERRLTESQSQHDTLQLRHTRGNAVATLTRLDGDLGIDLDKALRRWEVEVTRTELRHDIGEHSPVRVASGDRFADEFERGESDAALRAELDALREGA
ncbi:MAG: PspA/IM30 family protein [Gammaproteobacteria bacterium]